MFDGSADGLFVQIGGGRVNETVTSLQRIQDALFAYREIGDLKDTEAQHGHLDAVIQGDVLHLLSSYNFQCGIDYIVLRNASMMIAHSCLIIT